MGDEKMEWTTRDKSGWGDGTWQNEPDKVQWVDDATGLDCLIVRGPSGALCGYVGVAEGHPYFRVGYSDCAQGPNCGETWCSHSPGSKMDVHGGLTFSDACHDATPEKFALWCERMQASKDEAARYPHGDAARRLRERGHLVNSYEEWAAWMEASAICHKPLDGRPDHVWWLGFDCAHSGDLCPSYDNDLRFRGESRYDSIYRDRAYVEDQCRSLAQQLANLAA